MLVGDLSPWVYRIGAFMFGALWGSFLNVAIYRWPRLLSVVSPPSHCPACGEQIRAYRNVPIFGWLLLRGKASCCGAKITGRYVMVELIGGALCLALTERIVCQASGDVMLIPQLLEVGLFFLFACGLVVATFVDFEWLEIPDEVSIPLLAVGLVSIPFRDWPDVMDAAIGAGAGYLILQIPFVWGFARLFGRRGMGEGDPKLLMMIGAFIGWKGVLFVLVAAPVQAMVAAILARVTGKPLGPPPMTPERMKARFTPAVEAEQISQEELDLLVTGAAREQAEMDEADDGSFRRTTLPFGPFLSLAALEFLFFGGQILQLYYDHVATNLVQP